MRSHEWEVISWDPGSSWGHPAPWVVRFICKGCNCEIALPLNQKYEKHTLTSEDLEKIEVLEDCEAWEVITSVMEK